MQVHAALCFVGKWAEPVNALAVEVQFGAVLQAKDDPVLAHPGFSLGNVRIEDILPAQRALVVAGLIEKSIHRLRLRPIRARTGNTGRRLVGKTCRQFDQSIVQTPVAELRSGKFFHRPRRHRHFLTKMTSSKQGVYPFAWKDRKISVENHEVSLCNSSCV